MRRKFFVLLTVFVFTLGAFSDAFADKRKKKSNVSPRQVNQLAASLPKSDAVMTLDMNRLMNTMLPQVLSTKPQMMADINGKLNELKGKIGIDLKEFEQVAVGVSYKVGANRETDFQPLILGRGKFNSAAFIGIAKLAAKNKYREEKIGDKTIYIFSPKEIVGQNAPKSSNSTVNTVIDKITKSLTNEFALTNFDNNTLAIGTVERVKETLGKPNGNNAELLALVNRKPNAVMSFAANTPAGLSQFVPLELDVIGENLDSMRQMYGSLDYAENVGTFAAAAKMTNAKQAEDFEQMLLGLQSLGKSLLGGSQGADKQLYAKLVGNAAITRQLNEVKLDLQVPKNDVDALVGILIK